MKIQESNFFKTILTGKKITLLHLYFTTELIYVILTIIVKTRDEMINLSEKRRRNFQECIIIFFNCPLNLKKGKTRVEEFTAGQETSIARGGFWSERKVIRDPRP